MMIENVWQPGPERQGQVHDFSRMAVAGSQVDQAAFGQEVDTWPLGEFIAFDIVTGFKMADGERFSSGRLISTSK